jgi:outer membrane protein OmpA-like peptidoglycan-associated protein
MYAYGIGRSRLRTALGVDAPFDNLGPGVSLQPFAEYHFEMVTGDPDPTFEDFTEPRCLQRTPNTCNDNADQHWATVGLRAQVPGGLAIDLGVDVGLRSVGFPYGTAVAPFNLVTGLSFPFDFGATAPPRIVTKTVTVEKVVEREPPPRDGYVAGKVTNSKGGVPIAGAIVGVVGQRSARVASDADGTFMTKGLPAGEVQLEISAANFEPQLVKANVVVGHSVEIAAALNPKDQKSKLMGRVIDDAGKGVEGAVVKISGTADAQAQTDGSGSFALDLPAGSYAARIETAKFAPKSETFDLAAGVDRTLEISFKGATPVPAGKGGKAPKVLAVAPPAGGGGAMVRGKRVLVSRPVAFRVNGTVPSAALFGGSQTALDEVAELLTSKPQLKIRVEAHWDPSAGPTVEEVTKKQAEAVAAYLTKKGIAADRVEAVGMGAKKPVVPNIGLAARAKNRRVELHVAN